MASRRQNSKPTARTSPANARGKAKSRESQAGKTSLSTDSRTARQAPSHRKSNTSDLELDWRPFEGGRNFDRFEDMAVDLFVARYGEEGFTPNQRRPGRDGGLDGLFAGKIGTVAGPWKIACAIRQDFESARAKVVKENRQARRAKLNGLFFMTSFDANAAQIRKLEALAKSGLKGGVVWGKARLVRALRQEPWIRQLYFNHALLPGFVPLGHPSELEEPSQPDLPLVGRKHEVAQLGEFLASSDRVAVIIAPGGSGKTRLLRALPDVVLDQKPRRSSWHRRPGSGSLDSAFLSGLPLGRPMVVALDDAAQAPDEVVELVRLALSPSPSLDIKLVLAARSVDGEALRTLLSSWRDNVEWIEMAELATESRAEIARGDCRRVSDRDAERLARVCGGNLFLLRAAAQELAKGRSPNEVVNNADVRRGVATRFISDARKTLASVADEREIIDALIRVALGSPLPLSDTQNDRLLNALAHEGLLRSVGDTLRFRRDAEGDVLLAYLVDRPAERAAIEQIMRKACDDDVLLRRVRNLASAGRGYATSILRELVTRWLAELADVDSHRRLLPFLPYCAEAAPAEVARVCRTAVRAGRFTLSDAREIVLACGRSNSARGLRLALEVSVEASSAENDAETWARNITQSLLSPVFHSPQELMEALQLLDASVSSPLTALGAQVVRFSLEAVLSTVVRWSSSDAKSFTVHEREVPATPNVVANRRLATQLVARLLNHEDARLRASGVELVAAHGTPNIGTVSTQAFDEVATEEFASLIPTLASRLSDENNPRIASRLYTCLATRWAAGHPGSERVPELLANRAIDPIVKAYHFASGREWFYSFDEVLAAAPSSGERWAWWVPRYLHARTDDECGRVVTDLEAAYTTAAGVAACATALASAERPGRVLDEWCRRQPTSFAQAAELLESSVVRAMVLSSLRRHHLQENPRSILEDLSSLERPLRFTEVNALVSDANLNDAALAVELAQQLAADPDVAIRRLGLDRIQFRDDADPSAVLDVLELGVADGDWSRHWDIILYTLQKPMRLVLLPARSRLRQLLTDRFSDGKDWLGDEWHEERVLDLLVGQDDTARLDILQRLILRGGYPSTHQVGKLLAPLLESPQRAAVVACRMVEWLPVLGERAFETLEAVLEAGVRDADVPPDWLELASRMFTSEDGASQIVGLLFLSEMPDSPEACALLANRAVDPGDALQSRCASALWALRWPRGWTRNVGEPWPQLVALQETLERAKPLASASARTFLDEFLAEILAEIEKDRRADDD